MIEMGMILFLKADPAVTNWVDQRIVMLAATENVKPPLVVLVRSSTRRPASKTGSTAERIMEFELHCVAADPVVISSMARAVRQALEGYRGNMDGYTVANVVITDERDAFEPEARLYVRILAGVMLYRDRYDE